MYLYSHIRINIDDIYNTMVPSACQKVGMQRWCKREITIQREQYGVIVHLFIGTGRNPDKITSMPLTFTLNYNASYQGLSSLFPLRSVSSFILDIMPSRSSFSHSFGVHPYHIRVVSSYHTRLYHERAFIPKPKTLVIVYAKAENIWLVTFFRTFGRGRPPTVPITSNVWMITTGI
jgi:hypothetical protein